ncbi:DMT family transporter [Rubrimonas cliftonensis]|uniref:EamA-like transporter family protein n=1 Tax=Rubrimonas cliftonensis TaxID=89524 RepID=A0A1H4DVF7_9RHOB|nr:DMT family transporter [Rubrimonas cliftonensis]SEA76360.1 EamA-like transporter family protein [Rubrimonas cliftonensis]
MNGSNDIGAWARLVFLGMVWGGSFIAIAMALEGFTPLSLAAARMGLAALALLAAAWAMGLRLPALRGAEGPRGWGFALAIGLLSNALPFALLNWAQQYVAAGVASVFMALLPLMILPLSHLLVPGERLSRRKGLGFVAGSVGAVVLIGPQALAGLSGAGVALLAELACLGVVISYAFGSITTKLAPQVHPVSLSAAVQLLGFALIAPFALAFEAPFALAPDGRAWLAVAWLALLSTAFAQVLLVQVLRRAGPPFLSQVNFMIPLWALAFGALFLGEAIPPRALLALALIFVGMAVAQGIFAPRAPRPARSA